MSITRTCCISWKEFTISDSEIALLDKLSPVIGGEKFPLPLPTYSPDERLRRRAQYRNFFHLHKRPCDLTGKDVVSMFSKDADSTVWNQPDWWSNKMDGFHYAEDIDWEKDFSSQLHDFMWRVPQTTLNNSYKDIENSEYINGNGRSKDCYLTSCGADNEKCLYGFFIYHDTSLVNCIYARFNERCSFSAYLWKCYDVHFSFNCEECRHCRYSFSCDGSHHLLGCVWQVRTQYQILNVSCSETEYEATLSKLKMDAIFRKGFEKKVLELVKKIGIESNITTGSVDSTGDFCYDSKNAHTCHNAANLEDSYYINDCYDVQDSMDITGWWANLSLSYDCIGVGEDSSHLYWTHGSWGNSRYQFYCNNCSASSYLFACSGLHHQSYCIFNKQYTKEDWEINVKKLIKKLQEAGEWGEFPNAKNAWFPYDASYAMDILPLTEEEVIRRGLKWSNYALKIEWKVTRTIPAEKLPDTINHIPDDILLWAILSWASNKPYKIQPLELSFYREWGIPIPRLHPIERIHKLLDWGRREFDFEF